MVSKNDGYGPGSNSHGLPLPKIPLTNSNVVVIPVMVTNLTITGVLQQLYRRISNHDYEMVSTESRSISDVMSLYDLEMYTDVIIIRVARGTLISNTPILYAIKYDFT